MLISEALCDTSVVAHLVIDHRDGYQLAADTLFEAHRDGRAALAILDLGVYEFVNVLTRRHRRDQSQVEADVDALFAADFELLTCDRTLALLTARVAAQTKLSGYDAAFVAAAQVRGIPLITSDQRIIQVAPNVALSLESITE